MLAVIPTSTLPPFSLTVVQKESVFYGINHYRFDLCGSTHAEVDAINRLPRLSKKSKPKRIDIVVIRIGGCELRNSHPCVECIHAMVNKAPKRGYEIANIYYSTQNGEINKTNLAKLVSCDYKHVSSFKRRSQS